MDAPKLSPEELPALNLEGVGLELVLQSWHSLDHDFETTVSGALDKVGGELLFQMRFDGGEEFQHVAAARVGDGEDLQVVLISLPLDGSPPRVEPASGEVHPLGRFASSYADFARQV